MGALFNALERLIGTGLAFFYDLIPSFGVAIILLTVAINLIVFPLTLRQTRATRAFQAIQPEIKRIQKEHKEDKEKLQQELMRVQREAGATPGGCLLPMLVQFPIWLALFRVLRNVADIAHGTSDVTPVIPTDSSLLEAIRAGHTHFLGMGLGTTVSEGVTSGLPGALPYVVMLALMVASQYVQQWHAQRGQTPAGLTDQQRQQQNTQQMITRVMPLFIGFISWNFPAGLVLYWATANLFRLGQQYVIFAIDGRPTTPGNGPDQDGGRRVAGADEAPADDRTKPHPVSEKKRRRRRK